MSKVKRKTSSGFGDARNLTVPLSSSAFESSNRIEMSRVQRLLQIIPRPPTPAAVKTAKPRQTPKEKPNEKTQPLNTHPELAQSPFPHARRKEFSPLSKYQWTRREEEILLARVLQQSPFAHLHKENVSAKPKLGDAQSRIAWDDATVDWKLVAASLPYRTAGHCKMHWRFMLAIK
jgi:hypothetical protein